MSRYSQGAAVERQVADDLGAHGYDVIRSAASKGAADLVAVHDGELLFVQVKKNEKTAVSPAERRELLRISNRMNEPHHVSSVPLVAYKTPDPEDGRRSMIVYRELMGTGPKEWAPWIPVGRTHE